MLGWLRTRTQNIFIYAILGLIILAFTFSLGGGGGLSSASNPNNVSSVYGQPIDRRAFSNALADRERQLERMLGDNWTDEKSRQLGLPQQVLAELENQMLLRHAAEELGLEITDTELRDEIVKLPAFNTNGQFDYDRYKRALALQRRNAKDFEQTIRQELIIRKIQEFLLDSVHVSKAEVLEAYKQAREKVDVEFVAFDLKPYGKGTVPSKAEIAAFVEKEGDSIEAYYRAHLPEYHRPEQVRASHVLIKVEQGATPEELKEAEAEAARIAADASKKGADFAKLARKYSADAGSASRGGDLGFFQRGQMVGPFEEAAFGAEPGVVVGPVKTQFGFHVIKVEEKRPALDRKLEDVKEEIARALIVEGKAKAAAAADAQALLAKARGAKSLASLDRPRGARYGTTGAFTRGIPEIPNLGQSQEAIEAAFRLREDSPLAPGPITVGDSLVVLRLKSRTDAPSSPLEEDLAPLRDRLLGEKRRETMALWLKSARAEAVREGELERNEKTLKDLLGG